jgi:hypothetical protein
MQEDRILMQLERMVSSGRVTEAEAERLRATRGTPHFEEAARDIRVRHASAGLDEAVAEGRMSREEADRYLQSLRQGDHPKGLRASLGTHKNPEGS